MKWQTLMRLVLLVLTTRRQSSRNGTRSFRKSTRRARQSVTALSRRALTQLPANKTFQTQLEEFFELLSSASTNPRRPTHPDTSSTSLANASSHSLAFRPLLPLLSKSASSSGTRTSSRSLQQHPVVVLARTEAELAAREFLPQLLLRLDFARWFSRAEERRTRAEERERDRSRTEGEKVGLVLTGLSDRSGGFDA